MKKTKAKTLFLFLSTQLLLGQVQEEGKMIKGKIITNSGIFTEIEVVNLASEKSTKVDANGEFEIKVNIADVLIFASKNFQAYKKIIHKEDLLNDYVTIKMTPKAIELDEVVINQYANINSRALGIIPKNQRTYTVAERRLASGSGGISGIINTLSGRKDMLKKNLEVEKKETNLEKIKRWFTTEDYQKTFHITDDKINAFHYYCIENSALAKLIESNNKAQILLAMLQLAVTFNELQTNDHQN